MPLSAGDRRELDKYAAEIGRQAVRCRITRKHDYADVLDYDGIDPKVDIRFESSTGLWVVDCYCNRGCGVKQTQIIDPITGLLAEDSRADYKDAKAYLRPSGHSGQSGMGRSEIGYLRQQRIQAALANQKKVAAAQRAAARKRRAS